MWTRAQIYQSVATLAWLSAPCAMCDRLAFLRRKYWEADTQAGARCPRWDTALSVRYLGTAAQRSWRAKQLMSDTEVSNVALLINNLVDLEFFDENEEQEIFEFCVCKLVEKLADCLPNEYIFQVHSEKSMGKEHAKAFELRLRHWLYGHCDLPFLGEQDQRRIVRCVLVLLMRSMRKPMSQVGELSDLERHKLVFDVFVKGALEVFYDESRKRQVIANVENYGSAIPFMPHFILGYICETLLSHAGERVTPVLSDTYYEFLYKVGVSNEINLDSNRPFSTLLRRNLCTFFIQDAFKYPKVLMRFVSYLPKQDVEHYALLFVDSFLDAIDVAKLDEVMVVIAKDDAMCHCLMKDGATSTDVPQSALKSQRA